MIIAKIITNTVRTVNGIGIGASAPKPVPAVAIANNITVRIPSPKRKRVSPAYSHICHLGFLNGSMALLYFCCVHTREVYACKGSVLTIYIFHLFPGPIACAMGTKHSVLLLPSRVRRIRSGTRFANPFFNSAWKLLSPHRA